MALGRLRRIVQHAEPQAPKPGPQSFITNLFRDDVLARTRTRRAAVLTPTSGTLSRTYFGSARPDVAQRIPPVIPGTDVNGNYANLERLRQTLVARSRYFRSIAERERGSE